MHVYMCINHGLVEISRKFHGYKDRMANIHQDQTFSKSYQINYIYLEWQKLQYQTSQTQKAQYLFENHCMVTCRFARICYGYKTVLRTYNHGKNFNRKTYSKTYQIHS